MTGSTVESCVMKRKKALTCGSYRGIKHLDQVNESDGKSHQEEGEKFVRIDEMQFRFRPWRGTTNAIFIVRQQQGKKEDGIS